MSRIELSKIIRKWMKLYISDTNYTYVFDTMHLENETIRKWMNYAYLNEIYLSIY